MLNKLTDATTISLLDHLYEAGRDEDGGMVYGRVFIIIAETPDGFRFELDTRISDNTRFTCDDEGFGGYVSDDTAEPRAEALMNKVQAFVDAGLKLSRNHWVARQGCYGSAGWDEQAELTHEIRTAHEAGESVPSNLLALAYA
jgi:hypothetical protein